MVSKRNEELEQQLTELRHQLDEANETIEAIRTGQIDALVVKRPNGHQLYTLKTADQTYRVFIEKMREGAVTLNREGVVLYSNSRFASMVNLPLTKIIGSYFKDYVKEVELTVFDNLFKKGWKKECKGEINISPKEKATIPVLLSLTSLELDEGVALSIIITDLSDQKDIEKQLRENNKLLEVAKSYAEKLNNELEARVAERTQELLTSREHFKFLADTIPVIVWTASAKGEYDYFNRQWYNYTGFSPEDSRQQDWKSAIHADDRAKTMTKWNDSVRDSVPFKMENRLRAADGTYRWHLMNALPFKSSEGKVVAWFGVSTDIEEQKKNLQKKDEFISMASHELKTPVTSLKAYTEIMVMDATMKGNKEELAMLKKMEKQLNKLTRLIGDLLDVSRANAGELSYDFEIIDFNELVRETISVIQLTTKHKLEMKLASSAKVEADKNRLAQVIINLVSNAIKYSPAADRVIIRSEIINDNAKLCVQDFGIGIPLPEQEKLFNRFTRIGENTYPGLGLGLYISKEIVKRHFGTINVKSAEGKGSVFCFSIPVASSKSKKVSLKQ
ncbi:MAG: PAS domain-containing sensor histidine kinase [Ginsengibacter sp.]